MHSSNVSAGDDILASQYNNLREDVSDGDATLATSISDLSGVVSAGDAASAAALAATLHATTGHTHTGVTGNGSKIPRNIVNVKLTDDFGSSSTSFATRTGGSLSITIVTGSKILLSVRTVWQADDGVAWSLATGRINVDSGSSYINLGACGITPGAGVFAVGFLGGTCLIAGLSAAAHTFVFEVKAAAGADVLNYCTTEVGVFEMIAEEVF